MKSMLDKAISRKLRRIQVRNLASLPVIPVLPLILFTSAHKKKVLKLCYAKSCNGMPHRIPSNLALKSRKTLLHAYDWIYEIIASQMCMCEFLLFHLFVSRSRERERAPSCVSFLSEFDHRQVQKRYIHQKLIAQMAEHHWTVQLHKSGVLH